MGAWNHENLTPQKFYKRNIFNTKISRSTTNDHGISLMMADFIRIAQVQIFEDYVDQRSTMIIMLQKIEGSWTMASPVHSLIRRWCEFPHGSEQITSSRVHDYGNHRCLQRCNTSQYNFEFNLFTVYTHLLLHTYMHIAFVWSSDYLIHKIKSIQVTSLVGCSFW